MANATAIVGIEETGPTVSREASHHHQQPLQQQHQPQQQLQPQQQQQQQQQPQPPEDPKERRDRLRRNILAQRMGDGGVIGAGDQTDDMMTAVG